MNTAKLKVHFTKSDLLTAGNPVTINLIGAGGTGSKVLTALMEMNHNLIALGHAGLQICLWDDDKVTETNIGRQRFAGSETGLYKSVALINRANRWSGTHWKAQTVKFTKTVVQEQPDLALANIYISCVDSVAVRFEIAEILKSQDNYGGTYYKSQYWLDFGNNRYSGQVILSTVKTLWQPKSGKYETVAYLPWVTDEFGELLKASEAADDAPSCSVAEALEKQDLYINGALAQLGCSLLWGMFRNGLTEYRGFFLNLKEFTCRPLRVG